MQSHFLTQLDARKVGVNKEGHAIWRLLHPLAYFSARIGQVVVPPGFETDFASVPRLPLAYLLTGDTAHEAAVIHDYLYGAGEVSRADADAVLLEAMTVLAEPAWRRYAMYWAVRLFGGGHYGKREDAAP